MNGVFQLKLNVCPPPRPPPPPALAPPARAAPPPAGAFVVSSPWPWFPALARVPPPRRPPPRAPPPLPAIVPPRLFGRIAVLTPVRTFRRLMAPSWLSE